MVIGGLEGEMYGREDCGNVWEEELGKCVGGSAREMFGRKDWENI